MFPGKATEEDGDAAALLGRERPLDGLVEVLRGLETRQLSQPQPFRGQTFGNLTILLDLYKSSRHESPPCDLAGCRKAAPQIL